MNHPFSGLFSASELVDFPVQCHPAPFQTEFEARAEGARSDCARGGRLSRTERPETPPMSIAEELVRPTTRELRPAEPTRA